MRVARGISTQTQAYGIRCQSTRITVEISRERVIYLLFCIHFCRFAASKSLTTAVQMNEWPSTVARKETSRNCTPARNYPRHAMEADAAGESIKCTGKSCKSCTGGLIADCVAICCCPCAVVNILAFALLKVPWTIGKRALKMGKKKLRKRRNRLDLCGSTTTRTDIDGTILRRNGRVPAMALEKQGASELVFCEEFEADELKKSFSARFEEGNDEELWFELYEVGHLGFGRVSFTGIPSSFM